MNAQEPKASIVYFQDDRKDFFHELGGDTPARLKDGTMLPLNQVPEATDCEAFISSGWVEGAVRSKPTNYKFEVSCLSFENETEVWKALEMALRPFHEARNSPIPWSKITPPSRRIPQIDLDETYVVICREDRVGRRKGRYTLATRACFETEEEANEYAEGISPSREPLVVPGRFKSLRST